MNCDKISLVLFLLLLPLRGTGQEILSKEQESEIKESGKFYFSDCTAFDSTIAKECALWELTKLVQTEMIKQSVRISETDLAQAVEARAQTAQVNQSGTTILAWIQKDGLTTALNSFTASKPVTVSTPTPVEHEPTPAAKTDLSGIVDPVVRDLASCETYEQFRSKASGYDRQGKLVYGMNKNSFVYPDKCHIAVFSSAQKLIALLDTGQGNRKDLLTGKDIQNAEHFFSGNILVWMQIKN